MRARGRPRLEAGKRVVKLGVSLSPAMVSDLREIAAQRYVEGGFGGMSQTIRELLAPAIRAVKARRARKKGAKS